MNSNSMVSIIIVCSFSAWSNLTLGHKSGQNELVKKGAGLEKLADGFSFTEGPAADSEGNVFFTDQPNNRIMKWSVDGNCNVFLEPSGRANGLFIDSKGFLWACADQKNEIWRIGPDKEIEIIIGKYNGIPFNGPNDLWIAPDGGIYFTDPYYQRPWWSHTVMPHEKQCVYYISPDHKTVIRIIDDLAKPNGIIGTPDGKNLYVADIGDNKTWSYTMNEDGSVGNKILFCNMGSDGMTIDLKGNLYLTGKGVTIFDRTGRQLTNIPVPEKWTANVCFCDKDRKSLFITASTGIYRIKMKVRGAY